MATGENAEVVRRGYQAFNTGDMGTLTELFDESASWHAPGRSPLAGDYAGREAVFAYFGELGAQTGGTFRATLEDLAESDDGRVIGVHRNSGERDGKRLGVGVCLLFELRDGRIVDGREHPFDLYASDEFWS
jgi:ketosteroid isomerase-like protein